MQSSDIKKFFYGSNLVFRIMLVDAGVPNTTGSMTDVHPVVLLSDEGGSQCTLRRIRLVRLIDIVLML